MQCMMVHRHSQASCVYIHTYVQCRMVHSGIDRHFPLACTSVQCRMVHTGTVRLHVHTYVCTVQDSIYKHVVRHFPLACTYICNVHLVHDGSYRHSQAWISSFMCIHMYSAGFI